jgi:2-amino-4-hydroxy-6-hydroxymethyldihydropteridine diphosphokinase
LYSTAPVGNEHQSRYLNAVIALKTTLPPGTILRIVKDVERRAGRRLGRRWGPRTLDIDILDYGGRKFGHAGGARRRGTLILPHPELHHRAFVLIPLLEVAPHWRHPKLRRSGRSLLSKLAPAERFGVRPALDFQSPLCQKARE